MSERGNKRSKPRPLRPGEYEPLPFCAVLSPDGKFYRAPDWKHEEVGEAASGMFWDDALKAGWLRVSDVVHYAFIWREPTQAQTDAIWDYARFMGWDLAQAFDIVVRSQARKFYGLEKD